VIARLSDLFLLILISTGAALLAGPFWIRVALRSGLVDLPGSAPHKTHLLATPLAGGILISSTVAVAYLVLRPDVSRQLAGISSASAGWRGECG
jgi:UDP-N-acetylmuramyl pentapeptide phosphotransferase/UDP-N-acetylglucosamine-1-phosphate transferase